jgi:transcriptional regulator with GAF, ATPase, and Fis domain
MGKSDSKQASKQPYDEKEQLELIVSALNTGLALINPDMTLVWANDIIKKLFPDANLYGKKCFAVAENRTIPCEGCQAVLAFKDGEIHEREFQNKQNKRWYKVVALPIKDKGGRVIYVLEASSDIDDRKKAEKTRDQALKELEALKEKLEEENIYLKSEVCEARLFSDMIGTSNALRYVKTQVAQVASTASTVLIQGETGVGKELVARAIHNDSKIWFWSDKPFIKVNCAAIPSNLVESELFGHERGAFTDAREQRKGRFELADTGTLFLDEISELSQDTQAKILRVLQEGEFERVGGTRTLKSDVRIIAATNRDLNAEVAAGRFRADLFYRINVYPITVPPLRKRREDIPLLIEHFVSQIGPDMGKKIDKIPKKVMEQLKTYDWPGNVRELRNVVERSLITSPSSTFQLADFSIEMHKSFSPPSNQKVSLDEIQQQHIQHILNETGWKINGVGGAAEILQMKPSTLRNRMKKLGIKR